MLDYSRKHSSSLVSILSSPLSCLLDGTVLISLPMVSDWFVKWVIYIWGGHQSLNWKQDSLDLESWRPLVLEDIKTDTAELVNIWVVDLGSEEDLWWDHWVLLWQVKLKFEQSSFVWAVSWTWHLHEEMSGVGLRWLSIDSNNYKTKKWEIAWTKWSVLAKILIIISASS